MMGSLRGIERIVSREIVKEALGRIILGMITVDLFAREEIVRSKRIGKANYYSLIKKKP